MSDIAKCGNEDCPSKEKCQRYTAPTDLRQSWCGFKVPKNRKKCKNFWDNKESKTLDK